MQLKSINEWVSIQESKELLNLGLRKINRIELQLVETYRTLLYLYGDVKSLADLTEENRERLYLEGDSVFNKKIFKRYNALSKIYNDYYEKYKQAENKGIVPYVEQNFSNWQENPIYKTAQKKTDTQSAFDASLIKDEGLFSNFLKVTKTQKLYTYLDPPKKDSTTEEMLSYLLSLTDKPKGTTRLTVNMARNYLYYTYKNKQWFKDLLSAYSKWIVDNEQTSIVEIMKLIKNNPIISRLSRALNTKNLIKTTYRGANLDDRHPEEVIKFQKMMRDAIPTSTNYNIAYDFATYSSDVRKYPQTNGIITIWEIEPKDILIDTRLLGSVYAEEKEIIINPKTAKLIGFDVYEQGTLGPVNKVRY